MHHFHQNLCSRQFIGHRYVIQLKLKLSSKEKSLNLKFKLVQKRFKVLTHKNGILTGITKYWKVFSNHIEGPNINYHL